MARATQQRVSRFERAADGSMTLVEHLRELRGRLFKAALGLVVGFVVGMVFANHIWSFLVQPYCDYQTQGHPGAACMLSASGGPLDPFVVQLKVGLYFGIIAGAPIWLYQLWAFIAPGLHRRERRYTYAFVAVAAPLFVAGVVLAHLIVSKSLHFFLSSGGGHFAVIVDINGYFSFVTKMMLLFGASFEFPLLLVMLNFVGLLTAKRMLGWWRPAVFLMFLFGAIVTPTPDPFAMSILALCLTALYFGAIGVASINDRRRRRNRAEFDNLDDDAASPVDVASPIDFSDSEPVEPGDAVTISGPVTSSDSPIASPMAPRPRPLDERYDDDAT